MVLVKTRLIAKASIAKRDPTSFLKSSKDILAAADKAEPKIRRAMLDALRALEAAVPDLESLIAAGNINPR